MGEEGVEGGRLGGWCLWLAVHDGVGGGYQGERTFRYSPLHVNTCLFVSLSLREYLQQTA